MFNSFMNKTTAPSMTLRQKAVVLLFSSAKNRTISCYLPAHVYRCGQKFSLTM